MRHFYFTIICILLLITSCHSVKNTVITVKLEGCKQKTPVAYYITNPYWVLNLPDTIYSDSDGDFKIETSINKPQIFFLFSQQDSGMFRCPPILIKPGEKHIIKCKLTKDYQDINGTTIIGPNSEGQSLFSIKDYLEFYVFGRSPFKDKWDINKPETLIDSFNTKTSRVSQPYKHLFETKKIDKEFLKYAENYINFYIAYQLAKVVEEGILDKNLHDVKERLIEASDYIFANYPGPNNEILNSTVLADYMYIYNIHMKRSNQNIYDDKRSKGMIQTYELENAKKVLSNDAYKYYAIDYLANQSSKNDLETLDLFEKYKLEYPGFVNNRAFQQLEKKSVSEIKKFNELKDAPLPKGVIFLDKEKPVNSFNELKTLFIGKNVFIDCWATWCRPCIEQLNFAKHLEEFLSTNNIEIVYLAFENDDSREKVEIYCKKFNLIGNHIVTNNLFKKDFNKILGNEKGLNLPRYILLDKSGNIAISNAMSPSEEEKLYDQIQTKIN
jgi:thiol-disulfide isomerase/thioredoxin